MQLYLLVESSVTCALSICTPLSIVTLLLYCKVAYPCLPFLFRCIMESCPLACHFRFVVSWSRALLLVISVSLYYKVVHLYLLLLLRCIMRLEASPFHTPVSSCVAGDAGRVTTIESTDPSEVAPRKTDRGKI